MSSMSDKEFERLAVLHAVGALSEEEAGRFQVARAERGRRGERLVRGVQRALAGSGGTSTVPTERADLAAVTRRSRRAPLANGQGVVIAVLAVALAAALAWGAWLTGRGSGLGEDLAAAEARGDSLAAVAAARGEEMARQPKAAELAPILAASDLRVVPLAGPDGAEGRLLAAPGRGAILVARGLARDPDATVRLWHVAFDGARPVATLGAAPRGFLFAILPETAFLDGARSLVLATGDPPAPGEAPAALLEGRVR